MPHAEARFFRTVFTGLTGFARCRQQRKPQTTRAVYQKAGRGGTPRRPPARNPRDHLEPVREPVRPDIAAALRESPQHPVRDMAARVQARGGLAHRQAGEPLDLPRVRHGQGKGLHKRGQGLHGRPDEACGGMAAILFRHAVLGLRNSPYDARMMVKEAMPDRDMPCHTGPTPPTKKAPSRTATASSGDGTRREPTSTGSQGARSGSLRTGSTQSTGNGTCRPSSRARRPIGLGAAAYGTAGLKERVGSKGKGSDGILGAVDQRLGVVGVLGKNDARTRLDVKSGEQQGMAV